MSLVTINLNVDGTALTAFLEKLQMTLDEVKNAADKTLADVQTLVTADKAKIADLEAKLAAALANVADPAKIDAIGATVATIDAAVTPTP